MTKSIVSCYGEFDWPDDNAKTSYVRNAFAQAIKGHAPEVWRELYDRVLPIYRQLKLELPHFTFRDFHHYVTSPLSFNLTGPPYVQCGTLALLIRFLDAWSQTWNLVETDRSGTRWVFEIALMNLDTWTVLPRPGDEEAEFFSSGAGFHGPIPSSPKPPEGLPQYDPITIQHKQYLDWVRKQALDAIRDHPVLRHSRKPKQNALADSVQAAAEVYSRKVNEIYERSHFKRTSNDQKRNFDRHLEWTVRVQVKGDTVSEVSDSALVEASSVSRAVDEILGRIGIQKRADLKRGRFLGSKNQRPFETGILRSLGK